MPLVPPVVYAAFDRAILQGDRARLEALVSPGFMSWAGERPRGRRAFLGGLLGLRQAAKTVRVESQLLSTKSTRDGTISTVSRRVRLVGIPDGPPEMTVVQVRLETWRQSGAGWTMVRQDELPLERQLRALVARDQRARLGGEKRPIEEWAREMEAVDALNRPVVRQIVGKYGWPTIRAVGTEPAHNLWLLVQHMDRDPAFQRRCLRLMAPLVAKGEADPTDFAYLTDRVRVNAGQRQLYGSQWKRGDDGKWTPHPVEDEPNLASRRRKLGLPTMDEYRKQLERVYNVP